MDLAEHGISDNTSLIDYNVSSTPPPSKLDASTA